MAKIDPKPTIVKSSRWFTDKSIMIGLFLLSILLYINTLGHGFVLDDPLSLALNKNVTDGLSGIGNIISGGYRENNFGGQLYRPLSLAQFAIEWQISPNNPFIHHLFNVLWYAFTVILTFLVSRRWFHQSSFVLPILISLLFCVHPLHTEVVANIKSRDEIMSLFFILLAFLTWDKYLKFEKVFWFAGTLLTYFLALLSKETAITMFPVFGMIAYWIYNKNWLTAFQKGVFFLLPVLVILMVRQAIFGDMPAPTVDIMDNPIIASENFIQRLATAFIILFKYLKLLVIPYPLSSDYSYTVIPLAKMGDLTVWISMVLHIGLAIFALIYVKKKHFLSFVIIGYLMSISLFSQIPLVIGTMFGERLSYLASFWWVLGIVHVLFSFSKVEVSNFYKKPITIGLLGMVVVFSGMTILRNAAWKDNFTLFTTDAATYPQSVRLNNGAAESTLLAADDLENEADKSKYYGQAESYCQQILKIRPVPTAYLTLGNIRLKQQKYEEAIKYYDQVNDLEDIVTANKALAYRELGRMAGEKEQNITKSQEMLTKSLSLNDKDGETWFLMGVSYGVSGNHQLAAEHFEKAYLNNPSPDYAKNASMAYTNAGNQTKAQEYLILANK